MRADYVKLVLQFLDISIQNILYFREIYPPEVFQKEDRFGVSSYRSRHKVLSDYVHNCVQALAPWLENDVLEQIGVMFLDEDRTFIEQFVFQIEAKRYEGGTREDVGEKFRNFLFGLTFMSGHQKLPPGSDWQFIVHTKEYSSKKTPDWIQLSKDVAKEMDLTTVPMRELDLKNAHISFSVQRPSEIEDH